MKNTLPIHAMILAGGRGTRFWPRSRTRTPKQLLNIVGNETMLQQTARRLTGIFPAKNLWVVTNEAQAAAVRRNLPRVQSKHILAEPAGRNTAAAIGLAAIHLQKESRGDAVMAVLPADHHIANPKRYQQLVRAALTAAAQGANLVTLGIVPTRPESGYGYLETWDRLSSLSTDQARTLSNLPTKRSAAQPGKPVPPILTVRRFTEKPSPAEAKRFLAFGIYYWNAGMFFWRASTFLAALERWVPKTHAALMQIAATIGTPRYARTLRRLYPKLENISVDYAVMQNAARPGKNNPFSVLTLPADIGWSDIGSWSAVYDLLAKAPGENVSAGPHAALDATGNFFWSPKKFVAAIGVNDLVVVETSDALLICPRSRAQGVAKLVKWLEADTRNKDLL